MHKNAVDKGMYYDAEAKRVAWCGLFDVYTGAPQKPYFSFKAYNELYKLGEEYDFGIQDGDGLSSLGACGQGGLALMLSNCRGVRHTVNIGADKLKGYTKAEVYLIDETHDLELVEIIHMSDLGLEVSADTNSVKLIKFR